MKKSSELILAMAVMAQLEVASLDRGHFKVPPPPHDWSAFPKGKTVLVEYNGRMTARQGVVKSTSNDILTVTIGLLGQVRLGETVNIGAQSFTVHRVSKGSTTFRRAA